MKYIDICRRGLTFAGVGVLNTGIDFTVLLALSRVAMWPLAVANVVSYSCGLSSSYCLNRSWTFKDRTSDSAFPFISYAAVNLSGLVINCLALLYLSPIFGVALAKIYATLASFVFNYSLSLTLVFSRPKMETGNDASHK